MTEQAEWELCWKSPGWSTSNSRNWALISSFWMRKTTQLAQFYEGKHKEEAWCLGSQYWSRNPHVQGYNARFGILLDMVGGENSVFLKEGYSEEFAPDINKKVWKAAKKAGYGKTFIEERGDTITDDHLFINRLARIKTIDIIPNDPETGLPSTWHTIHDNMDHIDKNTLKAVGQTVLEVIYNEK